MRHQLILAIVLFVVTGFLAWLGLLVKSRVRYMLDRRCVYRWLRSNTRDEPGESHVDTATLAKGTRIPEDRVRRVCMSDPRIYHFPVSPEKWSVWRREPQSIYEKRGVIEL